MKTCLMDSHMETYVARIKMLRLSHEDCNVLQLDRCTAESHVLNDLLWMQTWMTYTLTRDD